MDDLAESNRILAAAVLWARNHIAVGVKPDLQAAIVERLDAVLADMGSDADLAGFRRRYCETTNGGSHE